MRRILISGLIALMIIGIGSITCSKNKLSPSTIVPSISPQAASPKPALSPTPLVTPKQPATTLLPSTAVQYCSVEDRRAATVISRAQGWDLVQGCSVDDLALYTKWVLVGGQYANPVYKMVFGDALVKEDEGYIIIKYKGAYVYGGKERDIWGVAGMSETDTLESAAYVVERGLPPQSIRTLHPK